MATLLQQLIDAIEASGESRRQVALGSGVAESQLSRLVNAQTGLTAESIERLTAYLRLEIVIRPQRTPRKGR